MPRTPFPCAPATLLHILNVWHSEHPNYFRKALHITPSTFDKLLESISDDPVLANLSSNKQMRIDHQLGIALFRFGHFGNAASLDNVANCQDTQKALSFH